LSAEGSRKTRKPQALGSFNAGSIPAGMAHISPASADIYNRKKLRWNGGKCGNGAFGKEIPHRRRKVGR